MEGPGPRVKAARAACYRPAVPASLLPALLALAAVAVAAAALATSRPVPPPEGVAVLAYGAGVRAAASVLLGLPLLTAALAAWRLPLSEEPVRFWLLIAAAALAFLLLWVVRIEVVGVRHRVTAEALERGSPWQRKPLRLPWAEVRAVRWSAPNQWFELEGAAGVAVRASRWLEGLPALARALEAHGLLAGPAAGPGVAERLGALARVDAKVA
jgi:hypothetical protein